MGALRRAKIPGTVTAVAKPRGAEVRIEHVPIATLHAALDAMTKALAPQH